MNDDQLEVCPICQQKVDPLERQPEFNRGVYHWDCPRCGRFRCVEETIYGGFLPDLSTADRIRMIGVIREQSERVSAHHFTEWPIILMGNIEAFLADVPDQFDVATKVRKLLSAVARQTTQPGEWINFPDATSHPLAYAAGVGEWIYLTEYAKEKHWLEKDRQTNDPVIQLRLTPSGWEEVQRRPRIESRKDSSLCGSMRR